MRRCGGPSGFSAFSHQQVCLTGPNQSGTVHAVCMCFSVGCVRACLYAVVPRCVSARAGQCGLKIILPYLYAVLRCATVAEAGCLRGRAPAVCLKGTLPCSAHCTGTLEGTLSCVIYLIRTFRNRKRTTLMPYQDNDIQNLI